MNKILKSVLLFLWIIVLLGFVIIQYFTTFQPALLESFIYWWVLIAWIFIIWKFRIKANIPLFVAVILLCVSILIKISGFPNIGEKIARLSFIGWIVGFIQALKEYRKNY